MNRYALTHLDDHVLLRDLVVHVTRNCAATADLLAHLAEVDSRKLYLPAAHPSMHSYCVQVLGLSEDAANKRIRVARKAREFPAIFTAVAEGQLHLSGAVLVVAHLTPDNVDELLAAVARKTKSEVEVILARRFPRQDMPSRVDPVMASASSVLSNSEAPASAHQLAPGPVEVPRPRVTPLAPERFSVQFTVGRDTYETLRYVQALLGHQVPSGDVAEVFDRALEALEAELEKTRFAATARPRAGRQRTSANPRYVPTHVKRAVWLRDGGQCAFVSENGARCPERSRLEFDHIVEVARGGEATIDGMRLRCRAHNQFEAERTFGAGFMQLKRDEARRAAAERRTAVVQPEPRPEPRPEPEPESEAQPQPQPQPTPEPVCAASAQHEVDSDLLHCLKGLGWRADVARLATEHSRGNPEASIEERLHAALKFLGARGRTYGLRQAAMNRSGAAGVSPSRLAPSGLAAR